MATALSLSDKMISVINPMTCPSKTVLINKLINELSVLLDEYSTVVLEVFLYPQVYQGPRAPVSGAADRNGRRLRSVERRHGDSCQGDAGNGRLSESEGHRGEVSHG